jgi:tetratricopeptide (TPR) repeat protein
MELELDDDRSVKPQGGSGVWRFLAEWLGGIAIVWLVLEIGGYLGFELLHDRKGFGSVLIASIGLNLALARRLIAKTEKRIRQDDDPDRLPKALLSGIREMAAKQDWPSVLRIAPPISRALWLEGQYRTRVELGKLVEDAAARTENHEIQIRALIDDIGWTSAALGELDKAAPIIARGVQLAQQHRHPFLAAKGQRHLAAVALNKKDAARAITLLDDGEAFIAALTDQRQKEEMRAGYAYARAEAFMAQRNFEEAEKSNRLAHSIYSNIGDQERLVKTFSQCGRIQEGKGQKAPALDTYRRGLALAEDGDRKDEVIINLLLIARLQREQSNAKEAQAALTRAKGFLQNTSLSLLKYIPDEIAPLLEEIK